MKTSFVCCFKITQTSGMLEQQQLFKEARRKGRTDSLLKIADSLI